LGDEIRSQDLHVAREHDQVHVLPQQLQHFPLGLALVLGVAQMMERDMIEIGQPLGSRMIADDRNDLARQFAGAVPVQQVGKTVVIIGNQNRDLGR
jgi:hypothetical protein